MINPEVSASGGLNAGYAVVYGNQGDVQRMQMANLMQQQNQARQDKIAEQQKQQQAHIAAMKVRYGDMFDPKNYDTLTDVNIPINEIAEESKKGLSELLNNNAPQQDVDDYANDATNKMSKMYQVGTAVKRNIDANLAPYKNSKSINAGSVGLHAYLDTLYKKDPATGKMVMKSPNELSQIPPDFNPVAEILKNNPDRATSSPLDIDGGIKNMVAQSVQGNGAFYGADGFKHKSGWKATYNPLIQDLTYDKDGTAKVVTISHPVPLTDVNGNPVIDPSTGKPSMINQISDEAYNHFVDTPEKKIITDAATIRYLKKDNPALQVSTDTPAFYQASKEMLYNAVKGYGGKAISKTQDVTAPAFVIKNMMGIPQGGGSNSGTNSTDDFLASVNNKYGQDLEVETDPGKPGVTHWFKPDEPAIPPTYKVKRIIPTTADQHDLDIVVGKKNSNGDRPTKPKTFTLKDGSTIEGYEYDPGSGDAEGDAGEEIGHEGVQERFTKYIGGVTESRKMPNAGERGNKAEHDNKKTTNSGLPVF